MSGSIVGNDPLKGWLMGRSVCSSRKSARRPLCPRPVHVRMEPALRRDFADPALVGAFGFAEVLTTLADPVERKMVEMRDPCCRDFARSFNIGAPCCVPASSAF
jgi:putative tricarboxylic transport membrane protein